MLIWGGACAFSSLIMPRAMRETNTSRSKRWSICHTAGVNLGLMMTTLCSPQRIMSCSELIWCITSSIHRDKAVAEKIQAAIPVFRYTFDTIGNETSSAMASRASWLRGWPYLYRAAG